MNARPSSLLRRTLLTALCVTLFAAPSAHAMNHNPPIPEWEFVEVETQPTGSISPSESYQACPGDTVTLYFNPSVIYSGSILEKEKKTEVEEVITPNVWFSPDPAIKTYQVSSNAIPGSVITVPSPFVTLWYSAPRSGYLNSKTIRSGTPATIFVRTDCTTPPNPNPNPDPNVPPPPPPPSPDPLPDPNIPSEECEGPAGPDQGEVIASNMIVTDDPNVNMAIWILPEWPRDDSPSSFMLNVQHAIITVNTPEARDLTGKLSFSPFDSNQPSNAFDIERVRRNSDGEVVFDVDGQLLYDAYALGSDIDVVEPGHVGCGIHTGHRGPESFRFTMLRRKALIMMAEVDPDDGDATKRLKTALIPAGLYVDANRDGEISLPPEVAVEGADNNPDETTAESPYFIWSNDDDDNPGETPEKDYLNNVVDGEGDLLDFFPVFLDIKQLLTVLPPSASVKYKLKQADGGLNFVYTNLTRATAFDYQNATTATTGYGPNFNQAAAVATTQQITAAGVELPAAFLTNIKDNNQGVILVEARQVSGAPLKLVVEKDNVQIAEVALNIASLRLYADPGKVHLGFDPPNKLELEDLAAPSTYWASVVQGTTNTILNLDLPASALAGVEWKIAAADTSRVDISPKTFTSATTDLTITGLNTGSNAPEETTLSLVPTGSNGPAILTLKVWVLPQREMGLAVYVLEDPDAPLTQFASSPVVPLPSSAEILAVVNDSMKQAGVRFTLHPSSGTYLFPYDTRGLDYAPGYSTELPPRVSDGKLSEQEANILAFPFGGRPAAADGIFPIPGNYPGILRVIIVKESGLPYYNIDPVTGIATPTGQMERGDSSGIFVFARNLPQQVPLAIAHEVGHKLRLSTAVEDSDHDQPPFSYAVTTDQPNGVPPVHPGNAIYQHKPMPNPALMQSGTPEPAGLPWVYGRWVRNEDWRRASRRAGGLSDE